jgi:hypothetical protein
VLLEGSLPALGLPEIVAARAQLDLLEKALVVEARRQWATWAEIGELLGLSPQATWKRFVPSIRGRRGALNRSRSSLQRL